MVTAFLWLQCKFHNILGKTKWPPRKFGHFMASGCSQTHFGAFSMTWTTFCTHQNHCYLCVLFSSQPQSTNFKQNLTRLLHFIGFTFEVGGAYRPTECGQLRLLTGVKGRKFETSSTKDTRDIHERSGQHLRG